MGTLNPNPMAGAPPEQEALKASIFQRLHPRVYFERFVSEGVRPDGRDFDAWRDVSVNVGEYHAVFVPLAIMDRVHLL